MLGSALDIVAAGHRGCREQHDSPASVLTARRRGAHGRQSRIRRAESRGQGRQHRYRPGRHGRHAGPADRQALPGRVLRRRRPRGDARLRLPARQRHRHGAGARLRGGELGQGLRRFRPEARPGDAADAALARRHGAGPGRRARPSPSRRAAFAARHAQAPDRAARSRKLRAFCASELEFYLFDETYKSAAAKRYHGLEDRRRLHRGLSHTPDHQGGGRHARHPPRPAGRRHPRRELQGRVGPGPGGDQRPLRRRAGDGRPPRHPQERRQGDRARARQGRHLHVQVALRPRRLLRAHPHLAVGRGRQEADVPRRPRPSTACRT